MRSNRLYRARRLAWRLRRSVPRIARPLSRVLPLADPPLSPIFVVGCPRSGTTLLLDALRASGELATVQSEGHILWDEFHHPRNHAWGSDAVAPSEIASRERAYLYLAIRLFARGGRFVDKTPANCLRVPYLEALFAGATFVFLRRRGADNVSSLMEGWRARPRFVRYRLPEPLTGLDELDGDRWSFVLVPGWRELRTASLEEICAHQYLECNRAVLDARSASTASWIDLTYEDLVASPADEVRRVYGELGLSFTAAVERFASELASRRSATSVTAPQREKWRERNETAIERVVPQLEAMERRLGYAT
ncbi:MAG TPA: sulfotransferase [Gaiellaceae bacterium]|nr:sulfotransferase [Gaiellaceae bacterium]